jgi:CubicO group peptidase (beta-lactamase class C family)
MLKHLSFVFCIALLFACQENQEKKKIEQDPDYQGIKYEDIAAIKKAINADAKTAAITEIIRKKVVNEGFNGNVLIAQKGIVLYKKSFGYANLENLDTLVANSKFQLASLSKTFTAVAIMMLAEQGKFSLENTVKDIYPNFPYDGVTIRSLLCHRSGLPNYQYAFDARSRKDSTILTNQKLMQWFAEDKPALYNKPDHFYSYNNSNFAVLAAIVEKMSGLSFAEYARQKIFLPLGMNDSYIVTTTDSLINKNRTIGFEGNRKIVKDVLDDVSGDKGVYSTTSDLYKWYKGLTSNQLLSPESSHELFVPRSFEYAGYRNYGFGFRLWLDAKMQAEYVYHTGWWKGYNTIMWFDPKDEYVIIILSNRLNRTVYSIKELVEVLNSRKSTLEDDVTEGKNNPGGL